MKTTKNHLPSDPLDAYRLGQFDARERADARFRRQCRAGGRLGGKARALKLSAQRRAEIASMGGKAKAAKQLQISGK